MSTPTRPQYGLYATHPYVGTPRPVSEEILWQTIPAPKPRKKRGRKPTPHITTGMYVDYCTGMSTAEVAAKWGVVTQSVRARFRAMKLPLRPRAHHCQCHGRLRNPYRIAGTPFELANQERTRLANEANRPMLLAALQMPQTERVRAALQLRLDRPELSMAAVAALCDPPMTKDALAGLLRRCARKVEDAS